MCHAYIPHTYRSNNSLTSHAIEYKPFFQVIAKLAVFTVYDAHIKNQYFLEKFLDRGSSASAWLLQNWWLFGMHIKQNHHFMNVLSLWILFILLDATLHGCFGVYYYCISHCLSAWNILDCQQYGVGDHSIWKMHFVTMITYIIIIMAGNRYFIAHNGYATCIIC